MRLIDANALKEGLSNRYMNELYPDWWELPMDVREKIGMLGSTFKQAILNASTIEAEPVRHGRWDENGRCTVCGGHAPYWAMSSTYYKSPYCFECGAKMDGGADK